MQGPRCYTTVRVLRAAAAQTAAQDSGSENLPPPSKPQTGRKKWGERGTVTTGEQISDPSGKWRAIANSLAGEETARETLPKPLDKGGRGNQGNPNSLPLPAPQREHVLYSHSIHRADGAGSLS